MSQYVTVEQLKEQIGIRGLAADTVDDAALQSATIRASALVDAHLDAVRPGYVGFAASSNARSSVGSNTRDYDGTGTDTLFIDDASSVATVSVDTVSVSSNSWRLWPYNSSPKRAIIYAAPTTSTQGLTVDHWTIGTANVGVTGYWGVNFVPGDVEQVALEIAIILWRRAQSGEFEPQITIRPRGEPLVIDPEIAGLLSTLNYGWAQPGVWGG